MSYIISVSEMVSVCVSVCESVIIIYHSNMILLPVLTFHGGTHNITTQTQTYFM